MIVTRLKMPLEQAEYLGLLKVAENELRNPIDQMRIILRQELERRGLLQPSTPTTDTQYVAGDLPPIPQPHPN